jgi:hypothetical protein
MADRMASMEQRMGRMEAMMERMLKAVAPRAEGLRCEDVRDRLGMSCMQARAAGYSCAEVRAL